MEEYFGQAQSAEPSYKFIHISICALCVDFHLNYICSLKLFIICIIINTNTEYDIMIVTLYTNTLK